MRDLLATLGVPASEDTESAILGALDAFSSTVAILDERGVILATNVHWRRFAEQNGGSLASCGVGVSYLECCRRATAAGSPGASEVANALEAILDGRMNEFVTQYPCHSPNEHRWFVLRMARFSVANVARVLVTHENVTRLKLSREAADLLAMVAARTANGVVITDPDQRIEWVNEAFTAITGYTRTEAVGARPGTLLQGEGSEGPALERIRVALRAGRSVTGTVLNYRKDGEPFYVELRIDPVRDANHVLTHFIAVQVDVTAEREREEEIAAAAQAERDRMAADLHDGLGQELTGAALMVSAGLATLPPDVSGIDAIRRGLESINRAMNTARELAHDLAPAHVNKGLLPSLEALANAMSVPGGLHVRLLADAGAVVDGAIAHHLYRIAQEAVTNAVRHGRARSVTIEVRRSPGAVKLAVSDDGEGLRSHVPGLGLRMMRNRALQMHGELSLRPRPQGGTVLECTVPADAAQLARTRRVNTH